MRVLGGIDICKLLSILVEHIVTYASIRYVCCAAELKRCEAKVLALQCSVDDLVCGNLVFYACVHFYIFLIAVRLSHLTTF